MFLILLLNHMVINFYTLLLPNCLSVFLGQYLSVEELASLIGAPAEGMKAVTAFFASMGNNSS